MILKMIGCLALILFIVCAVWGYKAVRNRRRKRKEDKERLREFFDHQKHLARLRSYPVRKLYRSDFNRIKRAVPNPSKEFLASAAFGTCFIAKPRYLDEPTVIGEIVKGDDLIVEQHGAPLLSLPERGINRYQVFLVDDPTPPIALGECGVCNAGLILKDGSDDVYCPKCGR